MNQVVIFVFLYSYYSMWNYIGFILVFHDSINIWMRQKSLFSFFAGIDYQRFRCFGEQNATSARVYCIALTLTCIAVKVYCIAATLYCIAVTLYCIAVTLYCIAATVYCIAVTLSYVAWWSIAWPKLLPVSRQVFIASRRPFIASQKVKIKQHRFWR